ncbi:MAG: COR domain-containing protein, partial [Saprospiraceae bacterium]
ASLGTVVTFDKDPELSDTHVINPQWLLEGVYKIINDPKVKDEEKGRFNYADLERILDETRYPRTRYPFLIGLMQSNELCYPIGNPKEKAFLLPDLFSDAEPPGVWDSKGAMQFRYNYDTYPPDAFMTRFIVAHHTDIVDEKRWLKGVVISNGTCSAIVRRAFAREHIEVEVQGPEQERRGYLTVIRETFRKLHQTFNLEIKREVPYKTVWLNYDHLLKYERNNQPYFHPDLEEVIPVPEILNGYASMEERRGEFPDREFFRTEFDKVERSQKRTRRETREGFQKLQLEIQETKTLLEASQVEVLKALEGNNVDEAKLEGYLSQIQQELAVLTEKFPELATSESVQQIEKALNTSAEVKGKFKLTWSVLPKALTDLTGIPNVVYEKEIAWNLKDVVKKIIGDFKADWTVKP